MCCMVSRTCKTCGTTIKTRSTGRPALYCGTPCRRMAEFEIRRAKSDVIGLENSLQYYRYNGRIKLADDEQQQAFVQRELREARAGLRRLLD